MKEGIESIHLTPANAAFEISEKNHRIVRIFKAISDTDLLRFPSLKLVVIDENELVIISERIIENVVPGNRKEAIINIQFPVYNQVKVALVSEQAYSFNIEIVLQVDKIAD